MFMIQLTGLPGAGKTTLAFALKTYLEKAGIAVEVLDGDACRQTICKDLGFSASDRRENIRRLARTADVYCKKGILTIIAAINPFEDIRKEVKKMFGAKTVWVHCNREVLIKRDPKGLYRRAFLPDNDPEKIWNLSGVNDIYETPLTADIIIDTTHASREASLHQLLNYIRPLLTSPAVNTSSSW